MRNTCTAVVAAEDREAIERCLYEPGVSMVCCRASAAAAVDVLVCLNHGNDILRRCDLSAAATWVSARRGPPTGRCSGGIFGGVLVVVVGAAAASGTTAFDTSSARRPPPPELGAAIDQSGSPSTGGTRRPPLLDRSLASCRHRRRRVLYFVCACVCVQYVRAWWVYARYFGACASVVWTR